MEPPSETISDLETNLQEYREQLSQINALLAEQADNDDTELVAVKHDLEELISVSEAQLLALKKSELLRSLDDDADDKHTQPSASSGGGVSQSIEDLLIGMRCRAPFMNDAPPPRGGRHLHNAIVMEIVSDLDDDYLVSLPAVEVRVLFSNPVTQAMKPCAYFLQDRCTYAEGTCKFSHGHSVKLGELEEYEEPNFSTISVDDTCLVRANQGDDLWQLARLTAIDASKSEAAVQLLATHVELRASFDDVLPLGKLHRTKSTSISSSGDHSVHDESTASDEEEQVAERQRSNGPLGEWETHTRGIGSKLLTKMGYEFGSGLGSRGQGKLEPIEARVLPKGKSLDQVAAMREAEESGVDDKRMRRKRKREHAKELAKKAKIAAGYFLKNARADSANVFEFLNSKLDSPSASSAKQSSNAAASLKTKSISELNVRALRVDEEMKGIEVRELRRLNESLKRNANDPVVAEQLRAKIREQRVRFDRLGAEAKLLRAEMQRRKDHKSMATF